MVILYKLVYKVFDLFAELQHNLYVKLCVHQGLKLGRNAIIRRGVNLGSEPFLIEIGDDSRVASGTTFVNHSGATYHLRKFPEFSSVRNFGRIKIGRNTAISTNCVILQNVEIGDNCILGANSVLSESMPSNTVYGGNPAKYICEIEDYGDYIKKTSLDYPIELEADRKKLNEWLKNHLSHTYKQAK